MHKAFVLVNCEPGKEPSVLEILHKIKNVVEASGTYGVYDILARIESDSESQLANIISDQIRKIDDVNSTLTLLPTENEEKLPDLIPDVIPEQKKPLDEEPPSEEYDDEDYEDSKN